MAFGKKHLDHLVANHVGFHYFVRPRQGLENQPLTGVWPDEAESEGIVCRERLDGVLRHYERVTV